MCLNQGPQSLPAGRCCFLFGSVARTSVTLEVDHQRWYQHIRPAHVNIGPRTSIKREVADRSQEPAVKLHLLMSEGPYRGGVTSKVRSKVKVKVKGAER